MLANDDLESGGADLFDRERIREYLAFLIGAVRRRRRLVAGVFSSIVALATAALAALPATYHVEARLLVQRNAALTTRGDGPDVAPTRGAVETIRRRENLVALVEATDLLHHWDEHRAIAQRMVDAIPLREDDEQERLDSKVERLEKRLNVTVGDGTVTIAIDWPDAHMARQLVEVTQNNFLEARRAQEVTALADSLAILRSHADGLQRDVDDAVTALDDLRAGRHKPAAEGAAATTGASDPHLLAESKLDAEQVQIALVAKQRALDDLETFRRHRLSELQARLAEQRATYTDQHPTIGDLRRTIGELSVPAPQIESLREEVASLRAEERRIRAVAGGAPGARLGSSVAALPGQPRSEILVLDQGLREDREPAVVYARGRLRDAMDKYSALREKVEAAQIDLETAQVAFKYRYSVLAPAKLPKTPVKPSVPLMLVAAILAGGLAAVLLAVVVDVHAGRIEERWQIERLLDRPVLGEIEVDAAWRSGAR